MLQQNEEYRTKGKEQQVKCFLITFFDIAVCWIVRKAVQMLSILRNSRWSAVEELWKVSWGIYISAEENWRCFGWLYWRRLGLQSWSHCFKGLHIFNIHCNCYFPSFLPFKTSEVKAWCICALKILTFVFAKPIQYYFNYQVINKLVDIIREEVFILLFSSLTDTSRS